MFRDKESFKQNWIILISSRFIEFWCFGLPAAPGVGGLGWMGWGVVGGVPTHVYTHAHTRMHARTYMRGKHDNFMQMAASVGFLGNPWEFLMMSYVHVHAHACMYMCVHMCGAPSHHPPPLSTHPPPPRGDTRNQSIFNSLELIEIFQFCLKIWNLWRLPHPWVGV